MFLGDLYLGIHDTMFFTYISLIAVVAVGFYIKKFKSLEILFGGIISSVCFLIITNFGAWLTLDMYEKSFSGLISSYVLAIPFFQNTLVSTILYLFLFKFFFEQILNKTKLLKI